LITAKDFDKLVYRKPKIKYDSKRIENVLGLDSEAYITGRPFVICLSDGTTLDPSNALTVMANNYQRFNFLVFNMKYDSGAILYFLPRVVLHELWKNGEADYKEYHLHYIPHKYLEIGIWIGKVLERVRIWDVAQFYRPLSLDGASKKYLGKSKIDIATKRFTRQYVKDNFAEIVKYCVQDAELTRLLGEHLFDKLEGFDIVPCRIYSSAAISFQYYATKGKIVTSWRLYKHNREALQYACDAYRGGKFEISARGRFTGHEYDLTSAYPFHISQLVDISTAKVRYSDRYEPDAVYGFIRVAITLDGRPHPCGVRYQNTKTLIYPSGLIYTTITKAEYDWLTSHNFDVKIYGGWWFFVRQKRYPYRDNTLHLFSIKDEIKKKDPMLYGVIKIILNGNYGKMAQVIIQPDKTYVAGAGWNPVYASYITALTRIMVTQVQYDLGNECIAVHTDSVMTKQRHDNLIGSGLGQFEYVTGGDGVLVASGMYQIADHYKFRGFKSRRRGVDENNRPVYDTWIDILKKMGDRSVIAYPRLTVESWCEAMAKNHTKNKINLFHNDTKDVDVNIDVKRAWTEKATGTSLLSSLEYAPPLHIVQTKPEEWK